MDGVNRSRISGALWRCTVGVSKSVGVSDLYQQGQVAGPRWRILSRSEPPDRMGPKTI